MTRFLDDVLEVLGGDGAGVFHGGGGQGVAGDLVAACGVALGAGLVIPFLLDNYTIRVAAMALYYVILASSWNLLLGYAGQLSFAHAAFAGIGAYTLGLLSFHYGVHPGFGVFIGGAVAAGIGWCLGRACLRTCGPYLALMTLGFPETVRLILQMGLILAMTIVGGLGTLTGPIIGAVLLVVMWEIMRDVSPYAHMLLFATLVIMVMKFFRAGIFGLIADRLKARGLISRAPPFTVE